MDHALDTLSATGTDTKEVSKACQIVSLGILNARNRMDQGYQRWLTSAVASLLKLHNDPEIDRRMMADEALKRIVKGLRNAPNDKMLTELFKGMKVGLPSRTQCAALVCYADLCQYIKPAKCQKYVSTSLVPALLLLARCKDVALQETLGKVTPRLLSTLGQYFSPDERKALLQLLLMNISDRNASVRRAASNAVHSFCVLRDSAQPGKSEGSKRETSKLHDVVRCLCHAAASSIRKTSPQSAANMTVEAIQGQDAKLLGVLQCFSQLLGGSEEKPMAPDGWIPEAKPEELQLQLIVKLRPYARKLGKVAVASIRRSFSANDMQLELLSAALEMLQRLFLRFLRARSPSAHELAQVCLPHILDVIFREHPIKLISSQAAALACLATLARYALEVLWPALTSNLTVAGKCLGEALLDLSNHFDPVLRSQCSLVVGGILAGLASTVVPSISPTPDFANVPLLVDRLLHTVLWGRGEETSPVEHKAALAALGASLPSLLHHADFGTLAVHTLRCLLDTSHREDASHSTYWLVTAEKLRLLGAVDYGIVDLLVSRENNAGSLHIQSAALTFVVDHTVHEEARIRSAACAALNKMLPRLRFFEDLPLNALCDPKSNCRSHHLAASFPVVVPMLLSHCLSSHSPSVLLGCYNTLYALAKSSPCPSPPVGEPMSGIYSSDLAVAAGPLWSSGAESDRHVIVAGWEALVQCLPLAIDVVTTLPLGHHVELHTTVFNCIEVIARRVPSVLSYRSAKDIEGELMPEGRWRQALTHVCNCLAVVGAVVHNQSFAASIVSQDAYFYERLFNTLVAARNSTAASLEPDPFTAFRAACLKALYALCDVVSVAEDAERILLLLQDLLLEETTGVVSCLDKLLRCLFGQKSTGGRQPGNEKLLRSFEGLVVEALKFYRRTNMVLAQQTVLRMLCQLINIGVDYASLDTTWSFINHVLSQFSSLHCMVDPVRLLPDLFEFLTLLVLQQRYKKDMLTYSLLLNVLSLTVDSSGLTPAQTLPTLHRLVLRLFFVQAETDESIPLLELRETVSSVLLGRCRSLESVDLLYTLLCQCRPQLSVWFTYSQKVFATVFPVLKSGIYFEELDHGPLGVRTSMIRVYRLFSLLCPPAVNAVVLLEALKEMSEVDLLSDIQTSAAVVIIRQLWLMEETQILSGAAALWPDQNPASAVVSCILTLVCVACKAASFREYGRCPSTASDHSAWLDRCSSLGHLFLAVADLFSPITPVKSLTPFSSPSKPKLSRISECNSAPMSPITPSAPLASMYDAVGAVSAAVVGAVGVVGAATTKYWSGSGGGGGEPRRGSMMEVDSERTTQAELEAAGADVGVEMSSREPSPMHDDHNKEMFDRALAGRSPTVCENFTMDAASGLGHVALLDTLPDVEVPALSALPRSPGASVVGDWFPGQKKDYAESEPCYHPILSQTAQELAPRFLSVSEAHPTQDGIVDYAAHERARLSRTLAPDGSNDPHSHSSVESVEAESVVAATAAVSLEVAPERAEDVADLLEQEEYVIEEHTVPLSREDVPQLAEGASAFETCFVTPVLDPSVVHCATSLLVSLRFEAPAWYRLCLEEENEGDGWQAVVCRQLALSGLCCLRGEPTPGQHVISLPSEARLLHYVLTHEKTASPFWGKVRLSKPISSQIVPYVANECSDTAVCVLSQRLQLRCLGAVNPSLPETLFLLVQRFVSCGDLGVARRASQLFLCVLECCAREQTLTLDQVDALLSSLRSPTTTARASRHAAHAIASLCDKLLAIRRGLSPPTAVSVDSLTLLAVRATVRFVPTARRPHLFGSNALRDWIHFRLFARRNSQPLLRRHLQELVSTLPPTVMDRLLRSPLLDASVLPYFFGNAVDIYRPAGPRAIAYDHQLLQFLAAELALAVEMEAALPRLLLLVQCVVRAYASRLSSATAADDLPSTSLLRFCVAVFNAVTASALAQGGEEGVCAPLLLHFLAIVISVIDFDFDVSRVQATLVVLPKAVYWIAAALSGQPWDPLAPLPGGGAANAFGLHLLYLEPPPFSNYELVPQFVRVAAQVSALTFPFAPWASAVESQHYNPTATEGDAPPPHLAIKSPEASVLKQLLRAIHFVDVQSDVHYEQLFNALWQLLDNGLFQLSVLDGGLNELCVTPASESYEWDDVWAEEQCLVIASVTEMLSRVSLGRCLLRYPCSAFVYPRKLAPFLHSDSGQHCLRVRELLESASTADASARACVDSSTRPSITERVYGIPASDTEQRQPSLASIRSFRAQRWKGVSLTSKVDALLPLLAAALRLSSARCSMLRLQALKSVLVLSDFFSKASDYTWMLRLFLKLHTKWAPAQDWVSLSLVTIGILKSTAVLGADSCRRYRFELGIVVQEALDSPQWSMSLAAYSGLLFIGEAQLDDLLLPMLPSLCTHILARFTAIQLLYESANVDISQSKPCDVLPGCPSTPLQLQLWRLTEMLVQLYPSQCESQQFCSKMLDYAFAAVSHPSCPTEVVRLIHHMLERLLITASLPAMYICQITLFSTVTSPQMGRRLISLGLSVTAIHVLLSDLSGYKGDPLIDPKRECETLVLDIFSKLRTCERHEATVYARVLPLMCVKSVVPDQLLMLLLGDFVNNPVHPLSLARIVFETCALLQQSNKAQWSERSPVELDFSRTERSWSDDRPSDVATEMLWSKLIGLTSLFFEQFCDRTLSDRDCWTFSCLCLSFSLNPHLRALFPAIVEHVHADWNVFYLSGLDFLCSPHLDQKLFNKLLLSYEASPREPFRRLAAFAALRKAGRR